MGKWDAAANDLGDLLTAIDGQVRESALRAHLHVIDILEKTPDAQIGQVPLRRETLLPREVMTPRRLRFKVDMTLRDNGASLSRAHRLGCGVRAEVEYEWCADDAPESTAIVRTAAELELGRTIKSVPWIKLTEADHEKEREVEDDG